MSATSLPPDTPRFLLDENFSHWLGELLPRFNYEVQQVQRVTELGHPHPKVPGLRHKASDREIADWPNGTKTPSYSTGSPASEQSVLCAVLEHRHRLYQRQRLDAIHKPVLFIRIGNFADPGEPVHAFCVRFLVGPELSGLPFRALCR